MPCKQLGLILSIVQVKKKYQKTALKEHEKLPSRQRINDYFHYLPLAGLAVIGLDGILGPDGPASLMAVTLYSYSLLAVTFVSSNSGTFTGVLEDQNKMLFI